MPKNFSGESFQAQIAKSSANRALLAMSNTSTNHPTMNSNSANPTPSSITSASTSDPNTQPARDQMPKVQDALGYLERVKVTFYSQPAVYNQFLAIMKDFKSHSINTEGVIQRVKNLFRGHKSLILGFNQFLPPGYKIDVEKQFSSTGAVGAGSQNNSSTGSPAVISTLQAAPGSIQTGNTVITPTGQVADISSIPGAVASAAPDPARAGQSVNSNTGGSGAAGAALSGASAAALTANYVNPNTPSSNNSNTTATASNAAGGPSRLKPTIEFTHAVNYVAKIKHRFRTQPEIYSEFLDILHDYQAKRTIGEVYVRVSKLFQDQKDLLEEFKYFLPDSARQTLNRQIASGQTAAASSTGSKSQSSSSSSKSEQRHKQKTSKNKPSGSEKDKSQQSSSSSQSKSSSKPSTAESSKDKEKDKDRKDKSHKDSKSTTKPKPPAPAILDQRLAPLPYAGKLPFDMGSRKRFVVYPQHCERELNALEKLREAMAGKGLWPQFVRALNLFSCDIITRPELIRMTEDICKALPKGEELLSLFKQSIGYDEWEEKQLLLLTQTNYYAFVSSVDFSSCPIVTPSYRELPYAIQPPHSSGRTAICDVVLNDRCVSTAQGSEDYSFKSSRKNVYEENLFKVEDERFELDMLIENNAAAIRVLEPVAEQTAVMSPEQTLRLKLGENIDFLHLRAITRVYADQAYEIVELLQKSPAATAKVVLNRLRQKDIEWRQVRADMKNTWRKTTEANYTRSLDHRSFYFKQEDKKRRSPKALMNELREVHQQVFGPKLGEDADEWGFSSIGSAVGEESIMLRQIRQGHAPRPIYTYCMSFKYSDQSIHQQLFEVITQSAQLSASEKDVVAIQAFFTGFVHQFFDFELSEKSRNQQQDFLKRLEEKQKKQQSEALATIADLSSLLNGATESGEKTNPTADLNEEFDEDEMDELELNANNNTSATAANPSNSTISSSLPARGGAKRRAGNRGGKKRTGPAAKRRRGGLNSSILEGDEEEDDEPMEPDAEIERGNNNNRSGNNGSADRMGFESKNDEENENEDANGCAGENETVNISTISAKRDASNSGGIGSLGGRVPSIFEIGARISAAEAIGRSNTNNSTSPINSSNVKPLRVQMETWAIEEKLHPVRRHTRPSRLFFGSNAYYVFFRLHQFLYERLHTARQLAHKTRKSSNSRKKLPVTPEEREQRFSSLLDQLLAGKLEPAKFEDECRTLLGASSYVLFTIDKLIQQLVKQTLALLNSDTSLQLLCLYQYELVRQKSSALNLERSAQLCRMYHSNCQSILAEDNCTQIEFFADTKEIGIGLIEALSQPESQPKSEEWSKYLDQHINQPTQLKLNTQISPLQSHLPYLTRNIRSFARTFQRLESNEFIKKQPLLSEALKADLDLLSFRVMKNIDFQYELESKIDLRTCKVYYVEDTSDYVRRKKKIKSKFNSAAVKLTQAVQAQSTGPSKFQSWAAARFKALFPNYEKEKQLEAEQLEREEAEADARALTGIKEESEEEGENMTTGASSSTGNAFQIDSIGGAEDVDDNDDEDEDGDDDHQEKDSNRPSGLMEDEEDLENTNEGNQIGAGGDLFDSKDALMMGDIATDALAAAVNASEKDDAAAAVTAVGGDIEMTNNNTLDTANSNSSVNPST